VLPLVSKGDKIRAYLLLWRLSFYMKPRAERAYRRGTDPWRTSRFAGDACASPALA
jgi:hypothetical protein